MKINQILRVVGKEATDRKGFQNEERVIRSFNESVVAVPIWFRGIDWAPRNLDLDKGVDFVIQSDIGKLYLQVKSSELMANKFRRKQRRKHHRKNKYIAVVVIHESDTDNVICYKVISAVGRKRQKLLAQRSIEFQQVAS